MGQLVYTWWAIALALLAGNRLAVLAGVGAAVGIDVGEGVGGFVHVRVHAGR